MELLNKIQRELKAPKGQFNAFGKYKYRNCEDILEAVKPLLGDGVLLLSDELVNLGDRFYVKATARLQVGKDFVEVQAYAREALDKKGMDEAQITGAASSYARKYALNGLFCIDDTKDADSDEKPVAEAKPVPERKTATPTPPSSLAKQREAMHKRIVELAEQISLAPLLGEEEIAQYVLDNTGLEFKPENYMQIGLKLKDISEGKIE